MQRRLGPRSNPSDSLGPGGAGVGWLGGWEGAEDVGANPTHLLSPCPQEVKDFRVKACPIPPLPPPSSWRDFMFRDEAFLWGGGVGDCPLCGRCYPMPHRVSEGSNWQVLRR